MASLRPLFGLLRIPRPYRERITAIMRFASLTQTLMVFAYPGRYTQSASGRLK